MSIGRASTSIVITKKRLLDGLWYAWVVRARQLDLAPARGGAVLCSFIDWFLLLLVARCLVGVSLVSRV